YNRAQMSARFADVTSMREELDRTLSHIEDRHTRAMRRVHEALLDTRPANTVAALQTASANYLKDMERTLGEGSKSLQMANLAWADTRLDSDMDRLRKQLERVFAQAQVIAPILDAMLEATAAADGDPLLPMQQDLDRADRALATLLRVTDGMIRSACTWQAWRAGTPVIPMSWLWWIPVLAWLPAAVVLSLRPLRGLRHLAEHGAAGPPRSREQEILQARLVEAERERVDLTARGTERGLELERAQHMTRRAEHELALLRFYNENLVNSLRSAILVTDTEGVVTSVNRTARALLGLDDSAVAASVETTVLYRALATRNPDLPGDLQRALGERRALRYEAVALGEGPEGRVLDLTLAPFQDESGAARGLLWVADDVTEAVQTKHQLLVAERLAAVGRLSAQVAHEIRNPLSAIGLNAELLEEEFVSGLAPERQAEAIALIRAIGAEIERLTGVTETYLHLARLPRPSFRPVDVNQLLADLFAMLGEEMRTHRIEVTLELASPPPRARVDPGQLRQALINIVRNSREAMAQGGRLWVGTSRHAAGVRITLRDTGPGIPPHIAHRVFEPFYSTKPQGTGLGLSLTQQIILEHGGSVEIRARTGGG
ncbi:MAG TPA: ATP-binding protein, partial [Myxococcota bacterium]|nr:ATP-binding protein [Myxococcota bacterium]